MPVDQITQREKFPKFMFPITFSLGHLVVCRLAAMVRGKSLPIFGVIA